MILEFFVLLIVWIASFRVLRARALDAVGLFLWLFGLLVVFRAGLLTFRIDQPFPDFVFIDPIAFEEAARKTMIISVVYLVATWLASAIVRGINTPNLPLPFAGDTQVDLATHRRLVWAFGLLGGAIFVWIISRSGGLSEAINAQKFDRVAGDSVRVRSVGTVSASLAMAYFLRMSTETGTTRRRARLIGLTFAVVGAGTAFAWGARDGAVFPLVTGVLYWAFAHRDGQVRRGAKTRALVGGAILAAVVVGLRFMRDLIAKDALESTLVGQSPVRQISVASNLVQFDSAVLVVRDWPERYRLRGSGQLANGILNYLPASFGGNSPNAQNANIELAQLYQPNRTNGWPHLAIGEWWAATGWAGVVLGGLICGVVVELLRRSYPRSATDPLQLMVLVLLTVVIFQFGIREVTFSRLLTIGAPLVVADYYARRRMRVQRPPRPATGTSGRVWSAHASRSS